MTDKVKLLVQDSGIQEYYTPSEIIDAAKKTMGRINTDPFSSDEANKIVKADTFYSENGFEYSWNGNVWVNHPFSRENNKMIAGKAIHEYRYGNANQICMITFAATSETWFKPLLEYPQCFLHKRTNYYLPDGTLKKGVTKGSVVTYLGENVESFYQAFKELGTVKVPYEYNRKGE